MGVGNNRGYDQKIFVVSTERKEIALLPGVGKFCICGCNKQIKGQRVKRKRNGKIQSYFLNPDPDQKFFNKYCKFRYYNKLISHKSKSSIDSLISLHIENEKNPYRVLTLYLKKGDKQEFKITPNQKELWNFLNKLSKYTYKKGEKI